jgi:UPF0755 protein
MMARLVRFMAFTGIGLFLVGGILAAYFWQWLHKDQWLPEEKRYWVVAKGESVQSVARRLHSQDILLWPRIWGLYARFAEPRPIRAGEYRLAEYTSPLDILRHLQSGAVITYQVTLVEGRTFREWIQVLAAQPKLQIHLADKAQEDQLKLLDLDLTHPEGWFYPDTYQYVAEDSDIALLRRAHVRMREVLERAWNTRVDGLPYKSPYEALIMASIIEKETGVASERPEIAGVFVRRLQQGMRLQTDPTVIYGLGADFDGNLTRRHLRESTSYNTYVNRGLPPTPIAMPSGAALEAALNPMPGTSLYFVARGDGTHQFSDTLEEHNRAVNQFQRRVDPSRYRSAPPLQSVPAP